MTRRHDAGPGQCPHCGEPLEPRSEVAAAPLARLPDSNEPVLYDLEQLARLALSEKAYDETVKVRVTQEDIRKLVAKRRKKPK
jgi:hypothetical protein